MKKFFVVTLFILSVITIFSVPLDEFVFENFNEAFEVAELTNKKVVVMFSSPTCPACTQFKETTLLDEEIQKWLRTEFVFVEIFPTTEKATFQGEEYNYGQLFYAFGARYTPTFVFFDEQKNPFGAITGGYPAEIFIDILKYVSYDKNEEMSLDKFIEDGLGKDIDVLPKTVYLSKDEIEKLLDMDPNSKVYEPGKNYDPYTNIVLLQNNTNEQNIENFYVKIFESKN